MRYLSVCSGIEAASVAWEPLGWKPVGFSEIEPFPSAVLAHRFPNVKNYGDMTRFKEWNIEKGAVDVLVGGTPCFTAGNMVLTEQGYKPIEDVRVGELVMTHKGNLHRVLRTGSKVADNVGVCEIDGHKAFRVTANHPFLIALDDKFPAADKFTFMPISKAVGHLACQLDENSQCYIYHAIKSFTLTNQPETVYNLEVEGDNSYVTNGVCVHNCQSFSVAGLRGGLDDPRGNLMLVFGAIADHLRPEWLLWENVPGVLSSDGGRDFGAFLGMLAQLGYGFAYRVLNAEHWGIPQRRRRIFVVGHSRDWRRAAKVLFDSASLSGDTPARGKRGKGASRGAAGGAKVYDCRGVGDDFTVPTLTGDQAAKVGSHCPVLVMAHGQANAEVTRGIAPTLNCNHEAPIVLASGRDGAICLMDQGGAVMQAMLDKVGTLRASTHGNEPIVLASAKGRADVLLDKAPTITCNCDKPIVFLPDCSWVNTHSDVSPVIGRIQQPAICRNKVLRRMTPLECERAQGFPDNHTQIPWRGKPAEQCPDYPRHAAVGNSMAVPVMEWLGKRMADVSERGL